MLETQKTHKTQKIQKPQRQVKKKPFLKTSICYDLCSTCIHAEYCSYPRDLVTPVHQCEEFDDQVEVATKREPVKDFSRADLEEPIGLKGLCVDCVDRKTCHFPKAEGGVWYCEEYA